MTEVSQSLPVGFFGENGQLDILLLPPLEEKLYRELIITCQRTKTRECSQSHLQKKTRVRFLPGLDAEAQSCSSFGFTGSGAEAEHRIHRVCRQERGHCTLDHFGL